ncbi:MAG: tRNA (N6-isopentenyl adenosine(37)-C2)-methylthiotransferase MiaB [Clostridia bacterium]
MLETTEGDGVMSTLPDEPVGRFHIQTYGCQMNEYDSEVMAGMLEAAGYEPVTAPERADIIILNTCAVRETAEERVLGELGRLKIHKYRNPKVILAIGGCVPVERGAAERILHRAPHVDLVFGTGDIHLLPQLLERARNGESPLIAVGDSDAERPEGLPRRREPGVKAWVPVIHGCENYCSYCVVPYVRGRERSRAPQHILREIEILVADGVREVTLLGQNVNSYGKDLCRDFDFADLLEMLAQIEGLKWIRYTTSHPRDFSHEMVDTVARLGPVCEHFHLPVQSGSDAILRRMNRGYDRAHYLDLVDYIRQRIPGASITTDVIVGFPGETEGDFCQTLDLFRRVRFDGAFSFAYSPRPGTAAAAMANQIPLEEKKERLARLNELQYSIGLQRNRERVGEVYEVLMEDPAPNHPGVYRARTATNHLVLVEAPAGLRHQFKFVRITDAQTFQLRGELVDR